MSSGVKWFLKWTAASVITVFCISIAIVLLYLLIFKGHLAETVASPAKPEVEYKDFVVIILTALSVMIALGGALVAFITIFGYVEAKRFIERKVEKFVSDDLQPAVERAVSRRLGQEGVGEVAEDAGIVGAVDSQEDGAGQ